MRFDWLFWISTNLSRAQVGSVSNKHNPSKKSGTGACISSRITTVIHVKGDHQINYNCFNEPFAVVPYKNLHWDMHGLIFETSIWLLAGSTRLQREPDSHIHDMNLYYPASSLLFDHVLILNISTNASIYSWFKRSQSTSAAWWWNSTCLETLSWIDFLNSKPISLQISTRKSNANTDLTQACQHFLSTQFQQKTFST